MSSFVFLSIFHVFSFSVFLPSSVGFLHSCFSPTTHARSLSRLLLLFSSCLLELVILSVSCGCFWLLHFLFCLLCCCFESSFLPLFLSFLLHNRFFFALDRAQFAMISLHPRRIILVLRSHPPHSIAGLSLHLPLEVLFLVSLQSVMQENLLLLVQEQQQEEEKGQVVHINSRSPTTLGCSVTVQSVFLLLISKNPLSFVLALQFIASSLTTLSKSMS